jgi:hypothetical protein
MGYPDPRVGNLMVEYVDIGHLKPVPWKYPVLILSHRSSMILDDS